MGSVGETLRRERLRAGLDLEKISQDTKISVRMLEQIETNQFHKLPGGVFARSFVRQYARAIGLDGEEMVAELERTLAPDPEPFLAVDDAPKSEPRVPRVEPVGGSGRKSSTLPALALVVLVMLGCSGAYTWWQQKGRHAVQSTRVEEGTPAAKPAETPAPTQQQETASAPAAPQTAAETSAPSASAPTQVSSTTIESSGGALHVALTAEEATWVQAKANGKVVWSGVIQPNETKSLQAGEAITLRIGNAGGVSISLNGKAIPAVGPKGQVRVVQVTSDGNVQVEPPKPPTPTQQTL